MKFWSFTALAAASCSLTIASADSGAQAKCQFRPAEETEIIEFDLPKSALSHAQKDLPLEVKGFHPVVQRKTVPFGQAPRVIISRYSTGKAPQVGYDDITQSITITNTACSGGGTLEGTSAACSNRNGNNLGFLSTLAVAGAAAMNENTRPMAALLAAGATAPMMGALAQSEDQCMPVVQVVVEAPAAYRGAVETCLAEINDSAICPDPFPTYPTCSDPSPVCKLAVVGAGTGGLYSALRMVDEGAIDASDICIFEQTERVAGRIMSLRGLGDDGDMTIDAGGYRTWPQFTPTAHALITEYLGIPMDCYDDSEPCQVYNIVDEDGKKAGFATYIEEMMKQLTDKGACFYPYHELVSIDKRSSTTLDEGIEVSRQAPLDGADNMVTDLTFANGVTATATWSTILNIPQRPLLNVVRNSNLDAKGLLDRETLDALHSVQTVISQKLYLYYPRGHVWWRRLGIRQGEFEWEGDARNMLLGGRYHDGPVYCDDEEDPDTCHGFLLAVYNNDLSGNKAQYFRRYQRDRPEPVTLFTENDLEGAEFLRHAHERLVDFHQLYNTNPVVNYTGFQASQVFGSTDPPPYAVLANWNTAIPWAGGAWHSWTDLDNIDTAMEPFVQDNIFVINEAFSKLQGWAEGTIKSADSILEKYFGINRPWDFDVVDINQLVRQTNSEECVAATGETSSSGGGGDSGGSSGGATAEDAILCFHEDSLVEMADGSLRRIQDVRTGDFVATGTEGYGKGLGLVTKALVHPVDKEVAVAVLDTEHGELVGTPDHPVYWHESGEWMELEDVAAAQSEVGIRLESRFISAFYNLEVDGNILEEAEATHSYVVNGVTASGLGDHEELNRRFPRQKFFHQLNKGHTIA